MIVAFGIGVAGGVGAGLRWLIDATMPRPAGPGFPWPILLVNVTGCVAFVALMMLGPGVLPAEDVAIVGTGLLGGYTTFSTVSVDTAAMWRQGRRRAAIGNAGGTLAACIAASLVTALLLAPFA
ncbi:fluoride efflux transporter FluC [Microbacterium sp. gxy059]|uniref:fluoride efflux transporter FluC n=1 Tax=Microbacterium sp. gxy059 TaxID=2957199 RepID=UPI003D9640B8